MSQVEGLGVTKARSVVTIGAFTAVYFVLMWCSGMLGFFGPAFMFVGGVVSLLLNGSVVMLMLVRSRMFGTLTIMGGVVGLLMVLTGHAWVTLPVAVVVGFLADLIARSGGYVSAPRNIAAYVVFSLWGIAPLSLGGASSCPSSRVAEASSVASFCASTSRRPALPEISPAQTAPGTKASRLDPRTKLLALLVLNAIVMRTGPATTLLAVQALTVLALAW